MSWFTLFYYAQVKFANLATRSSMPAQQKVMHQLTLPKYRSRTSTYRWMISSVTSSLSPDPIPVTKNSDAYRRYTTLVSVVYKCRSSFILSISSSRTFVLQKITHSRPASQHQLSYVLHNLCLGFGRHRREPFRQTNFAWESRPLHKFSLRCTGRLALPRDEENVVDHRNFQLCCPAKRLQQPLTYASLRYKQNGQYEATLS